mmetsp:Transcript_2000/g.2975  ORF Transcript_2000/g.2975 Transcript_2000/m.2975 type:complete len:135 (+) Transcript_2000:293-697(+)|eukprot:CAMPEP_0170500772 /NCGR_PEP_ID=MMETSP0208-20121228/36024_1 /TAXON_ID=197538 /ORGANISM="Strombidium inclinatum, Strain S3" /LENGTH=134 /DNA_ID=CAMNT_0010778961 /DNA_START=228 /DNA_END=632 /DNA_ORIENTATION=-
MKEAYRQDITEAAYFQSIPIGSFDNDPVMSVPGGLRANVQAGPAAVRLSSSGEGLPVEDLNRRVLLQGLGVDYFLSESTSYYIEQSEEIRSSTTLNLLYNGMGADMTGVEKPYSTTGSDHEQREAFELNEHFEE